MTAFSKRDERFQGEILDSFCAKLASGRSEWSSKGPRVPGSTRTHFKSSCLGPLASCHGLPPRLVFIYNQCNKGSCGALISLALHPHLLATIRPGAVTKVGGLRGPASSCQGSTTLCSSSSSSTAQLVLVLEELETPRLPRTTADDMRSTWLRCACWGCLRERLGLSCLSAGLRNAEGRPPML